MVSKRYQMNLDLKFLGSKLRKYREQLQLEYSQEEIEEAYKKIAGWGLIK